jgi:hypothetical protein
LRILALATIALLLSFSAVAAATVCDVMADGRSCIAHRDGRVMHDSAVRETGTPVNAETGPAADAPLPFRISVDGETIEDRAGRQRVTDRALEAVDIQVKFDGLEVSPELNVSTVPVAARVTPGSRVKFVASWNYSAFIKKAEIWIYTGDDHADAVVLPVGKSGAVEWNAEFDREIPISYTLRVYDDRGRFDETVPLRLGPQSQRLAEQEREDGAAPKSDRLAPPGFGEDRSAFRNIPVRGGSVSIYGRSLPAGHAVRVFGKNVPVAAARDFIVQEIVPPGDHAIDIEITDHTGKGLTFVRQITVPDNDWFYVGLADLTIGQRLGEAADSIVPADPGEYHGTYTKGRAAFYLKGKIKGEYLLTAALDTGEEPIEDVLRNLDKKDPRQLLRRLDPDDYYPVYGDDSTTIEDAPTKGRFYVRLERGDSHVMWGNYKTRITGSEFSRQERALYGANAVYRSEAVTEHGERRTEVNLYAAQPGTLPQRDEFRGTGGSSYFLRRQDVTPGSEQITIETRDRVTGAVVHRVVLSYGRDYDIDYMQGVIILRQPLSSYSGSAGVIHDEEVGGDDFYLVAQYEYTPGLDDIDGYALGARAQHWVNDHLRVGGGAFKDDTGAADHRLLSADIVYHLTDLTYLELEYARSKGIAFGFSSSTDGGFIFNTANLMAGDPARWAEAYRAKAVADLGDLGIAAITGTIGVEAEYREAGFSSPGRTTNVSEQILRVFADLDLSDTTTLHAGHDDIRTGDGKHRRETEVEVEHRLSESWGVAAAVNHSDVAAPAGDPKDNGARTDIGGRVTYYSGDDWKAYLFGQATVQRSGGRSNNHRGGGGFEVALTDTIDASAEVSDGSTGFAALAALTYEPTVDDHYYIGYRLNPDRSDPYTGGYDPFGRDKGGLVIGAKRRISEVLTAHAEESFDLLGTTPSLTHIYGVDYAPDAGWRFGADLEAGQITDDVNGDFDRLAATGSISYEEEGFSAGITAGIRFEDGETDDSRDRETYLLKGHAKFDWNDDWRLLAHIDAAISDSDQSSILDGDYIEGSIGAAYRPVNNDRLNALFRYTYLRDLPGPEQVNADDEVLGPRQESHILSADLTYDINRILTAGAKYGLRIGETETVRGSGDFVMNTAHLGILRADLHIVRNWDVLVEGRVLHLAELGQTDYGFLAAVYRHFGDNLKIGVGYNFGRFSDDLTDLTYNDGGVFLNIVGKW